MTRNHTGIAGSLGHRPSSALVAILHVHRRQSGRGGDLHAGGDGLVCGPGGIPSNYPDSESRSPSVLNNS